MTRRHVPLLLILFTLTVSRATATGTDTSAVENHARDIISKALQDKNPDTRKLAAAALSLGGSHEPFLSELETLLGDKDVEVLLATVASLADLKTKRATDDLHRALDLDVPEVSFAAAKALYALGDRTGKATLLSVLAKEAKSSSGFLTVQKREALRMVHTPKAMFVFVVKQGIGFAPLPALDQGISSMEGILSDPGVSGRAMAALLLGKESDQATLEALREALDDKDASVRAAAVHSLALRNEPVLQNDLVSLLDDRSESVRVRAAVGYLRLQWIRDHKGPSRKPQDRTVGAPARPAGR